MAKKPKVTKGNKVNGQIDPGGTKNVSDPVEDPRQTYAGVPRHY